MAKRPDPKSSLAEKELNRLEGQFDEFKNQLEDLAQQPRETLPLQDQETNTKISQNQIASSTDIFLKPKRTISSPEKGYEKLKDNPKFMADMKFKKELVYFTAENHEVIGETICKWTKPGAGVPAEEWEIPVNTPIWAPRYVAEELRSCSYTVYEMNTENGTTGSDSTATYQGKMIASRKKQRLDAVPASKRKSVFMGSEGF